MADIKMLREMISEAANAPIDKSDWGDGPWQTEPDTAFWIDEPTGFPCHAMRHVYFGCWCGYLGLPPKHPWYSLKRRHIPLIGPRVVNADGFAPIERGTKPVYRWLGFDCMHGGVEGDFAPGMWATTKAAMPHWDSDYLGTYRTLDWVKEGLQFMAAQANAPEEWQEIRRRLQAAGLWIDTEGTE